MKNLTVVALFGALLLAGCGSKDEAQDAPAMNEATEAAEQLAGDAVDAAEDAAETIEEAVEEAPTLVEESTGDPAEDEGEIQLALAQPDPPAASRDWQFNEGANYQRLVPTQPTVGGPDKIEVAEVFWYGCGHCFNFEPFINRWEQSKPANVRFERIPAMWNPVLVLHAQLYYTEQVLVRNGKIKEPEAFRAAVFTEYHQRGNRLTSESAIQALFARFGVSEEDFRNAWGSFEVAQKMRMAEDLGRRYQVSGVPMLVVNGKYTVGSGERYPGNTGFESLLDVTDELVERESLR